MSRILTQAILAPLRLYRWIGSPLKNALLGPAGRCRFAPVCSCYMMEAIERHGVTRGIGHGVWRLLRCHPWGGCGWDPVPPVEGGVEGAAGLESVEEAAGVGSRVVSRTF